VVLACTVAIPASARINLLDDPSYGTITLSAGFDDDPFAINLSSGGSNLASEASSECSGYIADAPDVRLEYDGGEILPLIISANSAADTTLVINAPDGSWHCDDDSGQGTNPSITFSDPSSGTYDIWVGTYGDGDLHMTTLQISELFSK